MMFLLMIVLMAGFAVGEADPCDNSDTTTTTAKAPETCTFNGRTYQRGQSVPSMERCTACWCDPSFSEPRCRQQACPTLLCPGRVPPRYPAPDACCRVCPPSTEAPTSTTPTTTTTITAEKPDYCTYYGRKYRRGQRLPSVHLCTECWCDPSYGGPRCRRQRCAILRCRGGARPFYPAPDACCPVCPETRIKGPSPPGPPSPQGPRK